MNYGMIVAGGIGKRFGGNTPKQFLLLDGIPVIIHSVKTFLSSSGLTETVVLVPGDHVDHMKELIGRYVKESDKASKVDVCAGGADRNDTIMHGLRFIEQKYGLGNDDIIVSHDSVRPFLSSDMISESIECACKYSICTAAFPAVDTIAVSSDGRTIDSVPPRSTMYQVQTPQSFKGKMFMELYEGLSDEERLAITDVTGVFSHAGIPSHIIPGSRENIKITYPSDMDIAEAILKNK
ncbi:MAG: 2-C-methyl-D-erythritol 4-phosphate cytidylyltransferase, partial [Lachnospiraceae bacterium]|nr:2-C-methyl-D-erythritol 4-phosphate cytidylyltransferase [Lachnospiraceae bacterium]MEE3461062.1 2-C-methyl-D-erythritol 4-phosphate cytidylyltransferase [Lachnospiraceae bacterium]